MNEIAKKLLMEKIAEKYGADVLEEEYGTNLSTEKLAQQVKELKVKEASIYNDKEFDPDKSEMIDKMMLIKNKFENCPTCDKYQIYFNINDDVYLEAYNCCHQCFIEHIDGREERWKSGWRPKNGKN
jgi:hypothetical protein